MTKMIKVIQLIPLILFLANTHVYALSHDDQLNQIIDIYNLSPASCEVNNDLIDSQLTDIGEAVFNTTVLSGDKDTSCSTCHIDDLTLTDGLPISVGVGGEGEGTKRMDSDGVIVPRNSFTLFGRASEEYNVFFWDGKVHKLDNKIFSPIGEGYQSGFNSALAVAAVLPVLARDEFLGRQSFFESNKHLELINEAYFKEKLIAANKILNKILEEKEDPDVERFRKLIQKAGVSKPDLPLIGNALASFIANKVSQCSPSPWDKYLEGDKAALSEKQKEGAILFFGKGRCAGCHSGSLFTDFDFHSLGVPQGEFGTHIHRQDIGRAGVTFRVEDRYKFRTPPLIKVASTPPYGHNGTFNTLDEIVRFHINPIPYFTEKGWTSDRELLTYGKLLSTRSKTLGFIEISKDEELDRIISYLESL